MESCIRRDYPEFSLIEVKLISVIDNKIAKIISR